MSMAEAEPPPAMKPSEEAGWQLPQVPQLQHPNEVRSRRPSPHHRAPSQPPQTTLAGLGAEAKTRSSIYLLAHDDLALPAC